MDIPALLAFIFYWVWIFALGVTIIAVGVYVGLQMHHRKLQKNETLHYIGKNNQTEE